MEKLNLWWKKRSIRDRRAIVLLLIIMPAILFWYMITIPLEDRLKMSDRVLKICRKEANEVQDLLQKYMQLKQNAESIKIESSPIIVTKMEQILKKVSASGPRPILNRTNINILGQRQPAAHIRLDAVHPSVFWQTTKLLASNNVNIAELNISTNPKTNKISASIKAWLPK